MHLLLFVVRSLLLQVHASENAKVMLHKRCCERYILARTYIDLEARSPIGSFATASLQSVLHAVRRKQPISLTGCPSVRKSRYGRLAVEQRGGGGRRLQLWCRALRALASMLEVDGLCSGGVRIGVEFSGHLGPGPSLRKSANGRM